MERKVLNHFCQKQHCAVAVLALSSSFVNREKWGKVFTEAWRECHILVSETPHNPVIYQRTSCLMSMSAWKKSFSNFEDSAPFLLVIKQSIQANTSSYHPRFLGTQIPHWVNVPWKHPALRNKKQNVKIKPLKSHRPYRTWNKNQGALLPWVKQDQHSTEKQNLPKQASNAMFASWVNPIKIAGGNGTKMPKTFLSETALCSGRVSTIIILREWGIMRESVHGSLTRVPHSGPWDTTQSRELSTIIISLK